MVDHETPALPDQGRPDPSQRNLDAIERANTAERDYIDGRIAVIGARLNGMDEATKVLHETVTRTPTDIQKAIGHVKEIMNERFASVATQLVESDRLSVTQFKERDTRTEREARDNKLAVDAAFAAQEKQAVAQNEGNQLAINKSEQATAETIKTNQELSRSEINALRKQAEDREQRQREVDEDMKKRLGSIESSLVGIAQAKVGASENRVDQRGSSNLVLTLVGTFLLALSLGVTVAAMFLRR